MKKGRRKCRTCGRMRAWATFRICVPCASKAEAVQYEAELHAQFALLRHRGEWFAHEGRLRDYLAQECRS